MSNRKPHNHLEGYVCELKSKHPKLPGHFGIFDKNKGGAWITGADGIRYGVAHLKSDNTVGGIVTVPNIISARDIMKDMAAGGDIADFGQHNEPA
ncbi:MAG: hypothetical protein EOP85_02865 [Verrucomicrobiaceae bacterium]|nr:MAG: hypothetical protein EOP85_02865 [Verrucomicrobiaceae bacterium]